MRPQSTMYLIYRARRAADDETEGRRKELQPAKSHPHSTSHSQNKPGHEESGAEHHDKAHSQPADRNSPGKVEAEPAKSAPALPAPTPSPTPSEPHYLPTSATPGEFAAVRTLSTNQIGELAAGLIVLVLLLTALVLYLVVIRRRAAKRAAAKRLSIKDREAEDMSGVSSVYDPLSSSTGISHCKGPSTTSTAMSLDPFRSQRERDRGSTNAVDKQSNFEDGVLPVDVSTPAGGHASGEHDQANDFEIDRCLSYYVKERGWTSGAHHHVGSRKSLAHPAIQSCDASLPLSSQVPGLLISNGANKQMGLLERIKLHEAGQTNMATAQCEDISPVRQSLDIGTSCRSSTDSGTSTITIKRPGHFSGQVRSTSTADAFEYSSYQRRAGDTSTSSHFLGLPSPKSVASDSEARRLSRRSVYSQESGQCPSEHTTADEIVFS